MIWKRLLLSVMSMVVPAVPAWAQAVKEPPKVYTGSFGGGIALTGGNTDTKNYNLALGFVRDPKTRNVIKTDFTYLRGSQTNVLSVDRTAIKLRDEYTFSGRTFAFGQVDYLRDKFKQIIFLWAPVGGVGYRLVSSDSIKFEIDGGTGAILERNPGKPCRDRRAWPPGKAFNRESRPRRS